MTTAKVKRVVFILLVVGLSICSSTEAHRILQGGSTSDPAAPGALTLSPVPTPSPSTEPLLQGFAPPPTQNPTETGNPTPSPSMFPSLAPTHPTPPPSMFPTHPPSMLPTETGNPTPSPSRFPTGNPTTSPSMLPTETGNPTPSPSMFPTGSPPTLPPSMFPTETGNPSPSPSMFPTMKVRPTVAPSDSQPVPKKGLKAGGIAGIIVVLLVLLGGAGRVAYRNFNEKKDLTYMSGLNRAPPPSAFVNLSPRDMGDDDGHVEINIS